MGALLIILRAFLTGMFGGSWCWNGLLHRNSSIPYVQMGRSIALCSVSLLSRDIANNTCI